MGRNEAHIIVVLPTVRSLGLRSVHTWNRGRLRSPSPSFSECLSAPKIWAAPPVPYSKHLQLLVRPSLLPYLQHLWEAQ